MENENNKQIQEWIEYLQDESYAPYQNLCKITNYLFSDATITDSEYEEMVEDLINNYIKPFSKEERHMIRYIEQDEEFQEFRKEQQKSGD